VQTDYTYEAFGRATATGASNSNSYQYTGREDDGTGLYYYRARYYSPILNRFLSEDPLLQSHCVSRTSILKNINAYSYVDDNPVNFTDPMGLEKKRGCNELEIGCVKRRRCAQIIVHCTGKLKDECNTWEIIPVAEWEKECVYISDCKPFFFSRLVPCPRPFRPYDPNWAGTGIEG